MSFSKLASKRSAFANLPVEDVEENGEVVVEEPEPEVIENRCVGMFENSWTGEKGVLISEFDPMRVKKSDWEILRKWKGDLVRLKYIVDLKQALTYFMKSEVALIDITIGRNRPKKIVVPNTVREVKFTGEWCSVIKKNGEFVEKVTITDSRFQKIPFSGARNLVVRHGHGDHMYGQLAEGVENLIIKNPYNDLMQDVPFDFIEEILITVPLSAKTLFVEIHPTSMMPVDIVLNQAARMDLVYISHHLIHDIRFTGVPVTAWIEKLVLVNTKLTPELQSRFFNRVGELILVNTNVDNFDRTTESNLLESTARRLVVMGSRNSIDIVVPRTSVVEITNTKTVLFSQRKPARVTVGDVKLYDRLSKVFPPNVIRSELFHESLMFEEPIDEVLFFEPSLENRLTEELQTTSRPVTEIV